jgi:hypothetical protein
MPPFPSWLLPVLLFAVWSLWAFAAAAERRAKELRRNTPREQRGSVSIFPVMPLFPLWFWGMARLADIWFAPWGSLAVGVLHLVLAAAMAFTLVRDMRYCLHHERT